MRITVLALLLACILGLGIFGAFSKGWLGFYIRETGRNIVRQLTPSFMGPSSIASVTYKIADKSRVSYAYPIKDIDHKGRILDRLLSENNNIFVCAWRDTGKRTIYERGGEKPSRIFLSCNFGPSWKSSFHKRDLEFRAKWQRDNTDKYEIKELSVKTSYGSMTVNGDYAKCGQSECELRISKLDLPSTLGAPLSFDFQLDIPVRIFRNGGSEEVLANFELVGEASYGPLQ